MHSSKRIPTSLMHLEMPPKPGWLLDPVAAQADLVLCAVIKAIMNVRQTTHTFRHARYAPMLLSQPRGTWTRKMSSRGANVRTMASMLLHCHKQDCPRLLLAKSRPPGIGYSRRRVQKYTNIVLRWMSPPGSPE